MRDNNANVNGIDTLDAGQFNAGRDEVQNAATAAGYVLDPKLGPDTNTSMLAGAMTESSQAADFYDDTGAVNAYVLTAVGAWVQPTGYRDGAQVRFTPGNTNTGAVTANISGFGVVPITLQDGTALTGGEIVSGVQAILTYDHANSRFFIVIFGDIDASQVISGELATARIPDLDTSKITTGTMAAARLPDATTTAEGIVELATTAEMTAGTANKIPDADKVKAFVSGFFSSARYVYTTDNNTSGPAYASGSWVTVLLGTEDYDPDGIGTLSSNQVTLGAGTYQISGTNSALEDSNGNTQWRMRLRDITGSSTLLTGSTSTNSGGGSGGGGSAVIGVITLGVTSAIELQVFTNGSMPSMTPVATGGLEMWNTLSITRIG